MGQGLCLNCAGCKDSITLARRIEPDIESQEDAIIRDWAESIRLEAVPSEMYSTQMVNVIRGFEVWLRQGLALLSYPKLGVLEISGLACEVAKSLTDRTNALCNEHPIQRQIALEEIWSEHPKLVDYSPPAAFVNAVMSYFSLIAVFKANYHSNQGTITKLDIDACNDTYREIYRVQKVSLISQWLKQRLKCSFVTFYAFKSPEKLLQLGDIPAECLEKNRSDVPFVFEMLDEPENFIRQNTHRGGLSLHSVGIMFCGETSEAVIGFVEVASTSPLTDADVWTADSIIREFGQVLENVSRRCLNAFADQATELSELFLPDPSEMQ